MLDEGSDHTFRPTITSRYPLEDHADNPLNPMVVQFCHPVGDVVVPSKSYELPRIHHFVLTNERGRKIYGTCLTVFEEHVPALHSPWNQHSLTEEDDSSVEGGVELSMSESTRRKALYLPKVLCLLSTWPYLTAFREYLSQLYRLAVLTDAMIAPIERFVVNLYEIPAPPPGSYEVQVSILNSTIRFWAPPAKLPIAYTALPFQILFECLDADNVLLVWSAMLMERKILLVSSQHSILTVCSEIVCSLLFPMRWSHLYIPLLPKMLCPMLDAPGTSHKT
jgi:DENN (AEX-3) domain/uDENN domain